MLKWRMLRHIASLVVTSQLILLACSSDKGGGSLDGGSSGSGNGGASSGGHAGAAAGGGSNGGHAGSGAGGSAGAAAGGRAGAASGGASGSSGAGDRDAMVGPTDAATDGTNPSGDAGNGVCSSCRVGELCVEHQTVGGALFLPDAGRCPDGRVLSTGPRPTCDLAPSYTCEKLPAACTSGSPAPAHCTCARSLCASANVCMDVSPTLMKCTLQAP